MGRSTAMLGLLPQRPVALSRFRPTTTKDLFSHTRPLCLKLQVWAFIWLRPGHFSQPRQGVPAL